MRARRQRHASPSTSRTRRFAVPTAASINFAIDPFRKRCLLDGLDDIGLTLEKTEAIDRFERDKRESRPWL